MKKQKSVFIICSVRDADKATRKKLETYKQKLEQEGYVVHLPHLDTNQKASGYDICMQNMQAIIAADEVHIFFVPISYGSHFDLGVTFLACFQNPNKVIKVIENGQEIDQNGQMKLLFEKSFGQMIYDWENKQNKISLMLNAWSLKLNAQYSLNSASCKYWDYSSRWFADESFFVYIF